MKMKNLMKVICVVFHACPFRCIFMNENEKYNRRSFVFVLDADS